MREKNFSLGSRFREEREKLGKTQDQVATWCGVTRRTIYNIEEGDGTIGSDLLAKLVRIGFDVQYIFSGIRSANLFKVAEEHPEYAAKETKTATKKKMIDPDVFSGVLGGVDEYLTEEGLKLSSEKKAELVMLLCDFFNAESAQDTAAVKSTAANILQFREKKR